MTTLKNIAQKVQLNTQNHGRGFIATDLSSQILNIDPFLVMTDFQMSQPFFPPHPHAGVSVMTYMLEDSEGAFINRDSLGDHSRIGAGAVHVTQAGKGVQHEEVPEINGKTAHGLQIWINHSAENRLAPPKAFHADSEDVTEVFLANEAGKIRVIQGEYEGKKAAFDLLTPVQLYDVQLAPEKTLTLKGDDTTFVFVLKGDALINGEPFKTNEAATFDKNGNSVEITTGANGVQLMFAAAKPLAAPIAFGGPFVMDNAEQLMETKRRYGRGEMGILEPSVKF